MIPGALCTVCQDAADLAEKIVAIFGVIGEKLRPPVEMHVPTWDSLMFEQQQVLVMACRRTSEVMTAEILDEMSEDALAAIVEVTELSRFLMTTCPELDLDTETPAAAAIRLLTPHVGNRVVLQ